MIGFPCRQSADENPASSLSMLMVSVVAMAALFGFGLATLILRLQAHARPEALVPIIPALLLSFGGLCAQFGMVRLLIRQINQSQP